MDLDCLLEREVVGRPSVGTAGAANNSLQDACTRLKIVCNSFHGNKVAAPLHRCACAVVSAFAVVGMGTKQVS